MKYCCQVFAFRSCTRCLDPTENGSYNSCLVCPACSSASGRLGRRCHLTPRDAGRLWRCDGCGGESPLAAVRAAVARGNERVRAAMRGALDRRGANNGTGWVLGGRDMNSFPASFEIAS